LYVIDPAIQKIKVPNTERGDTSDASHLSVAYCVRLQVAMEVKG